MLPIVESVHEAAGSYQVGTGLFLMRLKRRVISELVGEWLKVARNDLNHPLQLIELTKHDIAITAHFLGEHVELPAGAEQFRISNELHAVLLERHLRPLLEPEAGPPPSVTTAFGDST